MLIDLSDRKGMFYWQVDRKLSASLMKKIFLDRRRDFDIDLAKRAVSYGMVRAGKSATSAEVVDIGKPIAFGSINNAVPATLKDGTEVIIRIHPHAVKNGYFWAEKKAAESARAVGAPSFETYYIHDNRKDFDFDFMIMQRLPGKTMQSLWPIDGGLDATLIKETGKYMALIHKVKPEGFGFFLNYTVKNKKRLVGQYDKLSGHILSSLDRNLLSLVGFKAIQSDQSEKIKRLFEKYADYMENVEGTLIHNDIADWNTLVHNGHISGFIDWDECVSGDPIMDFAQWSLFFDEKRLAHMIDGYVEVSTLPENFKEKLHFYKLRYLVSKMVLRLKRLTVQPENKVLQKVIKRGYDVMKEEFAYFGI